MNNKEKNIGSEEIIFFEMDQKKEIEKITNLIKILVKKGLVKKVNDIETRKLNSQEIENNILESIKKGDITQEKIKSYISKLAEKGHINQEDYVKISLKSGTIMILDFLVYKNLMGKIEHKIAKITQDKRYGKDQVLSIILEMDLIKNKEKLYDALIEFGMKLKLGEYLVLEKLITYEQLKTVIEEQKIQKKERAEVYVDKIGKILVDQGSIDQAILDERKEEMKKLGINITDEIEIYDLQ